MKRWLRTGALGLVGALGLLAILLGVCLAYPRTLLTLAGLISERVLDRSLDVDGELSLDLSLAPRLTARDVRLGNATWSAHPDMLRVGYVMVELDLPALLERRVELNRVDVRDAELRLEDPVDGAPNWAFPAGDDGGAGRWSLVVGDLSLESSVVRAHLGELAPIELGITSLTESTGADGFLSFHGRGTLNGDDWKLRGRAGTIEALLAGGPVAMDLDLEVADIDVQTQGRVERLATFSGVDSTLSISAPDADLLGELFRLPEVFRNPIALSGSIRPADGAQRVVLEGRVSDLQVNLDSRIGDLSALEELDGSLSLSGPEAAVIGKAAQITGFPTGPFSVSGRFHRRDGALNLDDVAITTTAGSLEVEAAFPDFPRRAGAAAGLRLSGADLSRLGPLLRIPALPASPFELTASLDGTGTVAGNVRVGEHTLTADGRIGEIPTFAGTRVDVTASGPDSADLMRLAGSAGILTGPYRLGALLSLTDDAVAVSVTGLTTSVRGVEGMKPHELSLQGRLHARAGGWRIEEFDGRLGRIQFDLEGRGESLRTPAGLDLKLTARGPDINAVVGTPIAEGEQPFTLTGRVTGAPGAVNLDEVSLASAGDTLTVEGRIPLAAGAVGARLAVSGQGSDLSALLPDLADYRPPHQPWRIEGEMTLTAPGRLRLEAASLRVGSASLAVDGDLDLAGQSATDLVVAIRGDSLQELGVFRGGDLPAAPFELTLELEGNPQLLELHRLQARWGDSDLQARGTLDRRARPGIVLRGTSSFLAVDELQRALFGDGEAEQPASGRLLPDSPIPLEALNRWDWDVEVNADAFRGRLVTLRDVNLRVQVEDGVLLLERLHYRDQIGSFDATGTLRPVQEAPGQAHLSMDIRGQDADLRLFTSATQPADTVPRYNLDLSIDGRGATVAELAGALDGTALIWSDGGRIDNALLQAYAGDFVSNVLELLNPFASREPFTPMECLVFNAAIDDGTVQLEPGLVMRTDRLNMFVVGAVDLKTERLDLSLATQPRKGIGISAASLTDSYFKIGGTLAAPALQLDAESAALAAGVTAATGGLSVVVRGIWSRLRSGQNPCPGFLNYERGPAAADEEQPRTPPPR